MTPLEKATRAMVKVESGEDCFDALDAELQARVIESVKVVLEAVREPSDTMLCAGEAAELPSADDVRTSDLPVIYQVMIDAALAEG